MELEPGTVETWKQKTFTRLQDAEDITADFNGEVRIQGERFNIMGTEYFMAGLYHRFSEIYGKGAGGIFQKTGESYGADLLNFIDIPETLQEAFGSLLGLIKFLGYSDPEIQKNKLIFPSSPTAASYKEEYGEETKTCYFLAGMLTGALKSLDKDAQVVEEKCLANGYPHCVFRIKHTEV